MLETSRRVADQPRKNPGNSAVLADATLGGVS
jgi:hypothetical protein